MTATLHELRHRLNADYIKQQLTLRVSSHPYRWTLIALGAGLVAGVVLRRQTAAE